MGIAKAFVDRMIGRLPILQEFREKRDNVEMMKDFWARCGAVFPDRATLIQKWNFDSNVRSWDRSAPVGEDEADD